jgi:hypothetical protein
MPFFRPINLPAPFIAQSVTSVALGVYLTFFRKPAVVYNGYTMLVPANAPPRTADTISIFGILATGLEVTYLVASYMPLEENQFIAATVPVRLALAGMMAAVCAIHRKSMSKSGFWELVALTLLDGSAAIGTGLYLGRWDGMVVNAEKWL